MTVQIVAADSLLEERAERVVEFVGWPRDSGLLVVPDTVLDREAGITLWRGHEALNSTFSGLWDWDDWEVAILLDEAMGHAARRFPAAFDWLLGHEIGHALTAVVDPAVFSAQLFVQENIREASDQSVSDWMQIPFETSLDAYGLWVANSLSESADAVEVIKAAAAAGALRIEPERVKRLSQLEPISSLPDARGELRQFAAPYVGNLAKIWSRKRADQAQLFVGYGVDFSEVFGA